MEFSYAMIIFLSVFIGNCLFWSFFFYSKANKKNGPPEAGGARPLVGHLHLMGGSSTAGLPHISLGAMADKYGPIFSIKLGVYRTLVVSDWELVKQLFTTCDAAVSSRPRVISGIHLGYNFTMFSFGPYNGYWREIRKLISSQLLSIYRLEFLKHMCVSETAQFINDLYKMWDQKKDDTGRGLLEMKQLFGDLNLNVVLRMVVGKKFLDVGSNESRQCRDLLADFFRLIGLFVVADTLPYLRWLDIGGHEKKMKETAKELDIMIGKWLEEHRRKNITSHKDQDFMDVMLSAVKGANLQGYDPNTVIKTTCLSMIAGGSDSITIVLVWAVSVLLNNRYVLKKAQEELDIQIGRDRRVNQSDINNLVYLQAVVKETLRLYPALPLPGRVFTEGCTLGGYHVPKGTRVLVNLWKLHRDPRVWKEEPLMFRPERFLTTHGNLDVKGQHFEFIPFGAGRRICPGINFGIQMVYLVLADFLHAFDISTVNGELVDMTESLGLTNMKATALDVLLAPRLSPALYKSIDLG